MSVLIMCNLTSANFGNYQSMLRQLQYIKAQTLQIISKTPLQIIALKQQNTVMAA